MQGSNRNADTESKLVDSAEEGEGGVNRESSIETSTLPDSKTAGRDSLYEEGIEEGSSTQDSVIA